MKKIIKEILASACLITGLLIIICSCNRGGPASDEDQRIITPVTVTSVTSGLIAEYIELPAQSTFLNRNIVRSVTTGVIEKVLVTFGDYISKDQMLFTMKTREASVIAASLKADSSLAFTGEIMIKSSKEGIITSVTHQAGDFVQEGDELAVISDRESFVFILDVPFELRGLIDNNRKCTILFPDGKLLPGNITGQLPEMDPSAQTIRYFVKASVNVILPSNLNVKVKLVKRENIKATVLPREAVLGNETQTEFWIMRLINDSVAVKVPVKKGIENFTNIEITDPQLGQNDKIILTGGYGLPDTANVIVKNR
jgi:multidrug efflux pump subunit AcrA (membrane-fusion protein)